MITDQLWKAIEDSEQSLDAIARASGVDQSILSRFVREDRGILFDNAAKLCEYFGLELRARKRRKR